VPANSLEGGSLVARSHWRKTAFHLKYNYTMSNVSEYSTAYTSPLVEQIRADHTRSWVRELYLSSNGRRIHRTRYRPEVVVRDTAASTPGRVEGGGPSEVGIEISQSDPGLEIQAARPQGPSEEELAIVEFRRRLKLVQQHAAVVGSLRMTARQQQLDYERAHPLIVGVRRLVFAGVAGPILVPYIACHYLYREAAFYWRQFSRWFFGNPFELVKKRELMLCAKWGVDHDLYSHLARKAAFTLRSTTRHLELKSRAEAWVKEHRENWPEDRVYDQVLRATALVMSETPTEGAAKQLVGYYSTALMRANSYARSGTTGPWWTTVANVPLR